MCPQMLKLAADGLISLSIQGENTGPWALDLYLNIQGEPLYLVGNLCDTCQAEFKRVNNANLPLTPQQLSRQLEAGLSTISQDVIDTVAALLPKGSYEVKLITTKPILAAREKPFTSLSCQADYYWLGHYDMSPRQAYYELILPIVPQNELSPARINEYRVMYRGGREPTALAFSMHDYRVVAGQYYQTALAHFLLDGHHKVMAASKMGSSISILSFLWLDRVVDLYTHDYLPNQP